MVRWYSTVFPGASGPTSIALSNPHNGMTIQEDEKTFSTLFFHIVEKPVLVRIDYDMEKT